MSDFASVSPPGISVAVVGVGALGCPATVALAAAGVRNLTLVDDDRVERSNLKRQPLFDVQSLGELKAVAAAKILRGSFPGLQAVHVQATRLTADNVATLIKGQGVVIDATDNPETKFLLNSECRSKRIPLVYGGVVRTRGLAMAIAPRSAACLECAFAENGNDPDEGCSRLGVLAPVAGFVGALQAWLALGLLQGREDLVNQLFVYEVRPRRWKRLRIQRDPRCRACETAASQAA